MHRKLKVIPGITGWAQINGGHLISTEEKNALDEYYVRNASLWFDINILLKTVPIVITGDRRPGKDARLQLGNSGRFKRV